MNSREFTLVELLIVIAIIVVLVGMLLPALKKARESAYSTACQGNLKQLSAAIIMYSQNSDGWSPYSLDYSMPNGYVNYYELLETFDLVPDFIVNKNGVYCCPSGPLPTQNRQVYGLRVNYQSPTKGFKILKSTIDVRNIDPGRANTWTPSSFIIIGDSRHGVQNIQYCELFDNAYGMAETCCLPQIRHLNKGNFGFVDGHAESIGGLKLIDGWPTTGAKYFFSNYRDANGNLMGYY